MPQALACLAAALLLPSAWRRFGWGYAAFSLVSVAIPPIGTKDFMGTGRYVLAAFPLLAAAAVALTGDRRSRTLPVAVLVVLVGGLCAAAVAFVSGVQISWPGTGTRLPESATALPRRCTGTDVRMRGTASQVVDV